MSIATWLERATQGLSPLQRAVLVLQRTFRGGEPAPEVRDIEDEQQTPTRASGFRDLGLMEPYS